MQNNSITSQTDIANVTVVTEENQIIVPQPITSVIEVNNPGPQGPVGPQGIAGPSEPFANIGGGVYATTSSIQVSGSFLVSGSSTFTNIGPAIFSGSANIVGATTMSSAVVTGNVTVLGTASIGTLVVNQTVLSTGSNQLGDSANDTQTLYGSVIVPTGSLTVSGNISIPFENRIQFNNENYYQYSGLDFAGQVTINARNNNVIRFNGNNVERMRLTNTGNLLIGTTADVGAKLHISGSTSEALLVASSSAGTTLYVSGSGRVGIGTATPLRSLDVRGTARIENGGSCEFDIIGQVNNFRIGVNSTQALVGTLNSFPLTFYTNASERMRIDTTGNVGIGISTPAYKLDVRGEAMISSSFTLDSQPIFRVASGLAVNVLDVRGNGNMVLGGSSDVGIGTGLGVFTRYSLRVGSLSYTDASAILQADSTTRGFLPPRTSTTSLISSPAQGLITYVTGANDGLYYYNSGSQPGWHEVLTNTGSQSITGSLTTTGNIQATGFFTNAANGIGWSSPATSIRISTNDNGANIIANNVPYFTFGNNGTSITRTSGTGKWFELASFVDFSPSSGTTTMDWLSIAPTINQTGGANGITRGIHINPTLTSAANFRAIEVASGSVVFGSTGSGFFWDNTNSRLGIGKTPSSPYKLDVNGGIQTNEYLLSPAVYSLTNLQFGVSGGTVHFRMLANGNVQIFNSIPPSDSGYKLDVGGNTKIKGSGATSATTALRVENTNASASLVVLDNGNVGINTGSADYNLDVNGTIRVGGFSYFTAYFTAVQRLQFNNGSVAINWGQFRGQANGVFRLVDSSEADFNRLQFGGGTTAFPALQRVSASIAIVDATGGNSGSLLIGTTSSAGYALDVNGSTRVQGSAFIGPSEIRPFGSSIAANPTGGNLLINPNNVSNTLIDSSGAVLIRSSTVAITSNLFTLCSIQSVFSPTSGTGINNNLVIHPIINQTGGANGITRGIYINPTLTSAANFRAIETTAGNVLFQSGSTPLMSISSSGNVGINTTASSAYTLDVNGNSRINGQLVCGTINPGTTANIAGMTVYQGTIDPSSNYDMRLVIPTATKGVIVSQDYSFLSSPSALLEVKSTTKGFLPPRMTNAQRTAISTPAVGLMVYCTDATEGLYIYKSTGWTFIV